MKPTGSPAVLLVPNVDISWVNFLPLNAERNYLAEPPPLDQCADEVDKAVTELSDLVGGKFVFNIHSGTYCRDGFYKGPFLDIYRRAVDQGAELAIHTHEEIAGKGTRNREEQHVKRVILDRKADLRNANLPATCFRGGHFAYMDFLTPFLEQEGIFVDLSCAPKYDKPDWSAVWTDSPRSASYLCYDDHSVASCEGARSQLFEIPLGCDHAGTDPTNYLWIEESTLEDLRRVWDVVAAEAEHSGLQIVHVLFHTYSMGIPRFLERFRRFIDYAGQRGGEFVTPQEAKARFDRSALVL